MVKLLIFILAVAIEIFCIKAFREFKTKLLLGLVLVGGLNVVWVFARIIGLLP